MPGMNEYDFTDILQGFANTDSQDDFPLKNLGIRLFAFYYIGKRIEILSKKREDDITIKVKIQTWDNYAEIIRIKQGDQEDFTEPGMQIRIFSLKESPISTKSSLYVSNLMDVFGDIFYNQLNERLLVIRIFYKNKWYDVEPIRNGRHKYIGENYESSEEGKGKISIKHLSMPVINGIETMDSLRLARANFKEDNAKVEFSHDLDNLHISFKAQIDNPKKEFEPLKIDEIYKKALSLSKTILQTCGIMNIDWLTPKAILPLAIDNRPNIHSYLREGIIQINTSNPDYIKAMNSSEKDFIDYIALLIGKELIAFDDKNILPDVALEKMLSYMLAMKYK